MTRFAVFLRGINVGGVRITMKDLAAVLVAAGYRRVITVLASGNVILDADVHDAGSLTTDIESVLCERFGCRARVLVTTHEELSQLVAAYPFTAVDDGIPRHDYVVLAASRQVVQAVLAAVPDPSPGELVAARRKVLYWQVPRGESKKTRIAKELARTRHKEQVTTRNMNTLRKVLAKAAAED